MKILEFISHILEFFSKGREKEKADAYEPMAWGAKVSPEFRQKVRQIVKNLNFPSTLGPSDLMAVMAFESDRSFSPSIKNPRSTATGLIQFMSATAKELGTTTDALAAMTAEEQLDYVEAYFKLRIKQFRMPQDLADLYMLVFRPAACGKPSEHVLFRHNPNNETNRDPYWANRGLDINKDGVITKGEAATLVRQRYAEGRDKWSG